jgi:hypothetical protein
MQAAIKVALELHQLGHFKNFSSVMDMGTQELHVDFEKFKYWVKQTNLQLNEEQFYNLKNSPARETTSELWKLLGFDNIVCLDINGKNDSIYCDLNFPFDDINHIGKYDLVTDFGNNEHPFNVVEAYKTMHKLSKKNGYLWIEQSVFNGNGYFNFDIPFFEGLAAANNYSVIYSAYTINTANGEQYHLPCDKAIIDSIDRNKLFDLGITYIFKKNEENSFQYCYQDQVTKGNINTTYRTNFITDKFPPERNYVPSELMNVSGKMALKILIKKLKAKFKL